ncbi:TPA: hypothetical protein L9L74_005005 [Klebsiella pneumoniae]|nr:hypothetical protein [Klebsiella pneumoniae]
MTEEQIQKIRYYAACDIAHRWFAFFEGKTEEIKQHLDLFSKDIMLVHGGTHLLASGKEAMSHWLHNLPSEKGSHFIREIRICQNRDEAEMDMDIGYQAVRPDGKVGGALSEYRTTVSFDKQHNATFRWIQKTPLMPNPDKIFRDSFAENRIRSFIARFAQVTLLSSFPEQKALLGDVVDATSGVRLSSELKKMKVMDIHVESMDTMTHSCSLLLAERSSSVRRRLDLVLADGDGRYTAIKTASFN